MSTSITTSQRLREEYFLAKFTLPDHLVADTDPIPATQKTNSTQSNHAVPQKALLGVSAYLADLTPLYRLDPKDYKPTYITIKKPNNDMLPPLSRQLDSKQKDETRKAQETQMAPNLVCQKKVPSTSVDQKIDQFLLDLCGKGIDSSQQKPTSFSIEQDKNRKLPKLCGVRYIFEESFVTPINNVYSANLKNNDDNSGIRVEEYGVSTSTTSRLDDPQAEQQIEQWPSHEQQEELLPTFKETRQSESQNQQLRTREQVLMAIQTDLTANFNDGSLFQKPVIHLSKFAKAEGLYNENNPCDKSKGTKALGMDVKSARDVMVSDINKHGKKSKSVFKFFMCNQAS